MVVEENTKTNGKDLSRSDNKRNEVLFELFDHTIDKHLSERAQSAHQEQMQQKFTMLSDEDKHVDY